MSLFNVALYLLVFTEAIIGVPTEAGQTSQDDELNQIRELSEMLRTYGKRIEKLEKGNQQLSKLTENPENRNREWESKAENLEKRNRKLESGAEDLEKKNKQLESRTQNLEKRNRKLESRTEDLEKKNKQLESRMEILEKSTIQEMLETGDKEGSSDDPPNKHVTEYPEFQSVKKHLTGGENEFSRIRKVAPSRESMIGFYATMTDFRVKLTADQTFNFDNVITNAGTGYDVRSGHFLAPVAGLYFFSATILHFHATRSDPAMYAHIVKNGSDLGTVYANEPYDNGSRSVVLYLEAGDHVWVRNTFGTETVDGASFSSFSGFLISK